MHLYFVICPVGGWSANPTDSNPYLQIDFDRITTVSVLTLNGHATQAQWVRKYKLQYMDAAGAWQMIKNGGQEVTFVGNYDQHSPSVRVLPPGINAMALRLYPLEFATSPSLRWQILGCYQYGTL